MVFALLPSLDRVDIFLPHSGSVTLPQPFLLDSEFNIRGTTKVLGTLSYLHHIFINRFGDARAVGRRHALSIYGDRHD
jgi:hypothetical protein